MRDEGGTAAVTTLVMLPLLLIVLVGVLELGALRAVAFRATAAADLATLVAVSDQDQAELVRTGTLRLTADAVEIARDYFARNLAATVPALATGAIEIAASADIASFPVAPSIDPRTGARYDRPTIRLIAAIPVKTPGFAALLMPTVTTIAVHSVSSPR
ncbi:MAG: pilus assembly protein TadG-related protein [Chloroflexota bacterium]